jgi:excisionase family DNA binding protein
MTVWISVAEAATRLIVTRPTVYTMLYKQKLKGTKLPPFGFWVVDAASVKKVRKERARASRR